MWGLAAARGVLERPVVGAAGRAVEERAPSGGAGLEGSGPAGRERGRGRAGQLREKRGKRRREGLEPRVSMRSK